MSTTQKKRLLHIKTSLKDDFLLLNRITINEEISELFSCQVELLHKETEEDYTPTDVDVSKILGQPVTVTIDHRDGAKRTLSGIFNSFSKGGRSTRFSYYTATIVPHHWILTQNIQSRIFQHLTVEQILRKVLDGFEVSYEIQGQFKPRNYCVQYRESDYDFASRLMQEEGFYYYFEHIDGKHKMIIANTAQSHQNTPTKHEISYFIKSMRDEDFISTIRDLKVEYRLQSGKVTYRDHNFQLPTNNLEVSQPSRNNVGGNQELEIYDFPSGISRKYDGIDKTGGENSAGLEGIFPDKQRTVENSMHAIDAQYMILNGFSDCPALTAGHRFSLINHPNRDMNVQYIVTKITHEAEQNPQYTTDDDIEDPYTATFSCIPHGAGAPVFRPKRTTPKPIMHGSQTATVVGPPGEEIFTDKYGRIKIQFHWHREGEYNPDSSCWVRVAKDLAGKKYGSMYIPRVGQEVIIDFLHGDCDQPIATGSVYNPDTMPHYELPKFKTLTYIKTRTSPDDGKGFNELRFEDKQGKEQVFVHSNKRMDTRVKGSSYATYGGNRNQRIGVRSDNKPGGNLAITVGGNYDLHVKEAHYIGIDDKLNETVGADVVEDYQGKQQTLVSGKRELNAQSITLEALQKISLKVGGSFLTIDLSGITISGPMVKINSGGAAQGTSPAVIDGPLDADSADTGEPGYLDRPRTGGGRRGRNRRTLNGQHAPPFQTTTLPDGSVQVGDGIIIRPNPANPDFQDQVLGDLTEMSNHPAGMDTLNSMNNSGHTATIQETTGGNVTNFDNNRDAAADGQPALGGGTGTGNGTDSTIDYNRTPRPTSADPSVNRPADVGLHHELAHADDGAHGRDDDTPDPAHPGQAIAESNVIERDNEYRDSRGIPRRRDHSTL